MAVNQVPAALAVSAGLALFLLPGMLLLLSLRGRVRRTLEADEALFLVLGTSVAAASWLGLVLAELGRFSLPLAGLICAVLVAGAAPLAVRDWRPPYWRSPRPVELLPVTAVLLLALALQARPSEYIVGGRDPGAYIGAMALIGRTGELIQTDELVLSIPSEDVALFYRHPENPAFSWARFMGFNLESPRTGRVYPQFFHLFPAFGAYLFQAAGTPGALASPVVFGVLGTLGSFLVLRRLFGAGVALLAGLLLSINVVQVWFARFPVSEPMSQFLIFLGLLALWHWDERGTPLLGAIAGAAFGLSLLVRIDSILIVIPLAVLLFAKRGLEKRPWSSLLPLLLPFVALAGHAALHGLLFAPKYLLDVVNRPYWRQPPGVWLGVALVGLALLLSADRLAPAMVARLQKTGGAWRWVLSAAVVAAALYAYFLRPELSAWAGGDGNDPARVLADPGWVQTLGFRRLAAHDAQALLRLGWFVHPLALALAVAGVVGVIRRGDPRHLFPVTLALTCAFFYFYKIRVYNDYFFALRRYVPVVLPFLLGFASVALARLALRGRMARIAAVALALVLTLSYARDTFAIATHVDWRGASRFVDDLARRFGPEDVVVFEQTASIHLLSLPLWAAHGVNIVELARFNPDPEQLEHLIESWQQRYRNIYFVYTYRSDLCSVFLERVQPFAFTTVEWERGYVAPPRQAEPRALRFTLSRVVDPAALRIPPLDFVDVGGSDELLVSAGFYEKEGGGPRNFRWTGRCATMILPGATAGATIDVVAAAGPERPAQNPARVTVSLSGEELGGFDVGAGFESHRLTLPDPLPKGPPLLRFDVPDWRPINEIPGSSDVRDLGVMIDRVTVNGRNPS